MKGGCSLRRLTLSLIILALYFSAKLLYIVNEADQNDTEVNSEIKLLQSLISTAAPISESSATALQQNNTCSSDILDEIPPYVMQTGCKEASCNRLTCRNIISDADPTVNAFARIWMKGHAHVRKTDADLINATSDCATFLKNRYNTNRTYTESLDFPIAFSILVHKESEQFERLFRSIYRPHNVYCIHVDKKSPESLREAVKSLVNCFENVFLTKPVRIIYAGFSRLEADLNCLKDLINHKIKWKYVLNLAAQSYPLQTPEEMVKILRIYNGSNDIEGIYGRRILRHRFELEWVEYMETNTVNKTGKKNPPPPDNLDIVRGSAYGVFSRAFIEFVLKDKAAANLLEWSRKTFSPDEHYWATLNHMYSNPHLKAPGGYSGVPDKKHWLAAYVKWGLPSKCTGKFVRGICIFGVGDLKDIIIRKQFFANKFYIDYQPLAFECMEAWITHKTNCPVPFDHEFYKSLEIVQRLY